MDNGAKGIEDEGGLRRLGKKGQEIDVAAGVSRFVAFCVANEHHPV